MAVQVTLVSNQQAGGSGSDSFSSADYSNAAAAVAAVSGGFILFANPLDVGQTTSLGKARAVSVTQIREIVTI